MSGSLQSVLDGFAAGAHSVDDLSARTGLHADLVRVALDQLVALGLVTSDRTSTACPDDACGGCSAPTGSGCGTPRGGLITLTLAPPPRRSAP